VTISTIPTKPAIKVPVFQLYGEKGQLPVPDRIHCESIASRSRLHNWEINPHRHHGLFQVLWLEQGEANFQLDGRRGVLAEGAVLLVPQHCVHGFKFSKDAQGMVATLAYSLIDSLDSDLAHELTTLAEPVHCDLNDLVSAAAIEAGLRALYFEYQQRDRYHQALIESLVSTTLAWLMRENLAQARHRVGVTVVRAREHLAGFVALVDKSFAKHTTLDHYAVQLGISVAHLNAICREVSGRSALQLIHERLMVEARRELIYTSMTIKEIAELLGFSDPAYFTRFFKRQMGMSPKDFRSQSSQLVSAK
jgi:AraC family transcriptional activator of pobA